MMDESDADDHATAAIAMLTAALPAAMPAPTVVQRLRERILAQARREAQPNLSTRFASEGDWTAFCPQVRMKVLRQDASTTTALFRLEPGAELPLHAHLEDEECFIVEGDIVLGGALLHAGDFQLARTGSEHIGSYSPSGCMMLVRTATKALSAMTI